MIENNYYNLPYIHGHFAYTIGFNPRHKEIFPTMDETTIARTIFDTFPGTRATTVWGDTSVSYTHLDVYKRQVSVGVGVAVSVGVGVIVGVAVGRGWRWMRALILLISKCFIPPYSGI